MKVTMLESTRLSPDFEYFRLNRRRLFKSAGLVAIGTMLPAYSSIRQANAGWVEAATALIEAAIAAVDLYKELWHVNEPTQGKITFINYNSYLREGNLWLGVLSARYGNVSYETEDASLLPFSVPANRMITYGFDDGPYGQSPGQKVMEGRTDKGRYRTSMTVEL